RASCLATRGSPGSYEVPTSTSPGWSCRRIEHRCEVAPGCGTAPAPVRRPTLPTLATPARPTTDGGGVRHTLPDTRRVGPSRCDLGVSLEGVTVSAVTPGQGGGQVSEVSDVGPGPRRARSR